jgi:diguanylate cyclase (GGDEF)-like protein
VSVKTPTAGKLQPGAPLTRALGESKRVRHKVKQAASDLASVNAALKNEVGEGAPVANVERALDQSEAVEVKVQEASNELAVVNDTLAEEIDERARLEERLLDSDAALVASRADEKKSRHEAMHDAATGLPNLTLFNDRLGNALAQAQRHNWRLAVMFIDLDEFKHINDTHGHHVGDSVLQTVARHLQAAVRGGDTVSRRSGDEFLLLMLEARDQANVEAFATRIGATIATPFEVGGTELSVKASIGIALYPEDGRSPQELLKNADIAMYAAKKSKTGVAFHRATAPATSPRT